MVKSIGSGSPAFVGIVVLAGLLAILAIVQSSLPVAAPATSPLVAVAMFGIAALTSLMAWRRFPVKGGAGRGRVGNVLPQVGFAKSLRVARAHSVQVSLLPVMLLAAGPALFAMAAAPERVVVAGGDGIALASVCRDGQYILFVTTRPETEPWRGALQAAEATDRIAVALRFDDKAEDNERLWFRISGMPGAWSVPNGRTYTSWLEAVSVPQELYLRIWLPGEDRSGPGHLILEATQEVVAHMWLNAITC